jgi:pyruvate formate lyase activating enzyme
MTMASIHSIETMGLVDGPGVRFVAFLQGCALRCQYCHNPDTWKLKDGQEISVEELLNKVKRYKAYFKTSGGGVTLSGGEPLLQPQFAAEFFRKCNEEEIHTALDTSGYGLGDYDEILKYTDLVILDLKHIDKIGYKKITGFGMDRFNQFLQAVRDNNKKIWIRHVVVPGINDTSEHIAKLANYINGLENVENVEILPYHIHGVNKYKEMNLEYKLEGVPPLSFEKLEMLKKNLMDLLFVKDRVRIEQKSNNEKDKQIS